MIPGAPNPLMWGQGDPLDELGKIERSVRFRGAQYLSRTFAAGNQKTWLWFGALKRALFAANQAVFGQGSGTISNGYGWIRFNSSDQIEVHSTPDGGTASLLWTSTAVFRDPASHLFVLLAVDTTQATGANRIMVFVNGVQLSGTFATTPALNADLQLNRAAAHQIGCANASGINTYFGGYGSFVGLVDGYPSGLNNASWTASNLLALVGQFHQRTGQWRSKSKAAIKAVVDAGGANSFFLPFDDPTNTTTLCADASSKGNNWTANNISLTAGQTYDSLIDTPTNNFPVLNPLDYIDTTRPFTISNGNLNFTGTYGESLATMQIPSAGKWYFEYTWTAIGSSPATFQAGPASYDSTGNKNTGGGWSAYGATWAANDVIGAAVDMDAGTVTFYKNGVSQGAIATSNPSRLIGTSSNGGLGTNTGYANFGQRPFAYTPPTGFKSLCTKNLPLLPTSGAAFKSSAAFVAVTDTGANILATLAAAETWPSYIRIVKRRDAAEGWRWMFSDDAANYLDSSGTAAKTAIPSFSGSSYVAYSLKVSANNGVATGRLVHTNGVADVVADGLAKSRKFIILKNEGTGSWYVYHPDLTAGKLLYLEQSGAETTDSSINSVTTAGFTVAAALPSGTYRWVSIAETAGFCKMGKHLGNGSNTGPFDYADFAPAFSLFKSNAVGSYWATLDNVRSPYNVASTCMWMNRTDGDQTNIPAVDHNSNGLKLRSGSSADNANYNGYNSWFLMFSAFPFRYANAR